MLTIRQRLLLGLFLAALACALAASVALYRKVREEANELADLQLHQIAATLPDLLTPNIEIPAAGDPEEDVLIQAWDQRGQLIYSSQGALNVPRYAPSGFRSVELQGQGWRIFGVVRHDRLVQVSQPMAVRERLARHLAMRVVLPLLAFIPIFGLLAYVVVGRALRPLERMARAVADRSPSALQPLELAGLSPELRPVVDELNALLGKIDHVMAAQRNFVADAAHELRSPLTALKLQLQLAERAVGDEQRTVAFGKLHERLERASHLVQQLLTLARHDPEQVTAAHASIDLHQLAQRAVADHSTYADSREIDLGVDGGSGTVLVLGHADGLAVLLNNLVDNALRYTQVGGRVDLYAGIEQGRAVLRVSDNGPGVPQHERARLFDRFYRPDGNEVWGCGLGMAIVKNVADLHRAEVALSDGVNGRGLVVSVLFQPLR